MRIKKLINTTFEKGNTCVTGLRGCGKDMLMSNVVARRKGAYISNIDYKVNKAIHLPLHLPLLDIKNGYFNFVNGDIVPYEYPYPEKADIYISDGGVYFPSQYCNELNKHYPEFINFQALSRHLGDCNIHFNVQNLNRMWDKLREQSDIYIKCNWCCVLDNTFLAKLPLVRRLVKNVVFQSITIYDKYQSCLDRVEPFKACPRPLFCTKEMRAQLQRSDIEAKRRYSESYGTVKKRLLIYRNKSKYDTRLFKSLLKGKGGSDE